MDDQQTYLLNGLLARQFGVGRIVRFRRVSRGRQAETLEIFTAQEKEYLVLAFPANFERERLAFSAQAVNLLDGHRFTVMPFLSTKSGALVGEGPQNGHLLVSLAPSGSALEAAGYTPHDISQVGLRLAWMHRLLNEQLAPPMHLDPLSDRFRRALLEIPEEEKPRFADGAIERLYGLLMLQPDAGWAHGDISPAGLLHDGDHQLRAVMDWGCLHYGTPLEDVVDAFVALATSPTGELDRVRGASLVEAYATLIPLKRIPWTPVVATWCAQRLLDMRVRALPAGFETVLASPERLATAIASCV